MDKFQNYLDAFDIAAGVSDEEIERTKLMLQLYGPALRRSAHSLSEMEEECFESRRQNITDFVNLAIDYDRDKDRKRIAERLADIGHSMQLLSIMEEALIRLKDDNAGGGLYYDLIRARYFDSYCKTNEDAFLNLGISSATFYRNIGKAVREYAAQLWCVVIPDLMIQEGVSSGLPEYDESLMRDEMIG